MKGLQEQFLNKLSKHGIAATFYLINGYQLKGTVRAFDDYTLLIASGGDSQMVFKHAVSTILPHQPVDISVEQ